MKTKARNFSIFKEAITPDNVLEISELIAMSLTKHLIGYIGTPMEIMHKALCVDVFHINDVKHVLSDSYDLVQDGALFLCQHYGQRLTDIIRYSKKGKPLTLLILCERQMEKLVNRKLSAFQRNISFENISPLKEPKTDITEIEIPDYHKCDKIIESLKLTDNMKIALECRMSDMSYPEIGRIISKAQSTVYEYFTKMRTRYTALYGGI